MRPATNRAISAVLVAAHFLLLIVLNTHQLSVVFYAETALIATVFCARYSRRHWRKTPEGRHLMYFTGWIAGFMWFALVVVVNPDLETRDIFRLLLLGGLVWHLWVRNLLLSESDDERAS